MDIPSNLPMSPKEIASASEVFEDYLSPEMYDVAWKALRERALDTSRPFRAYDCAHAVVGQLSQSA